MGFAVNLKALFYSQIT